MGQIYKGKIDTWYGGMGDDVRVQRPEIFSIAQHFDIWSNPRRLRPYPSMVADENTTYNIVMFGYANSILYGLGVVSGTSRVKLFYKATDAITGSWTAASSGESSGGARFEKCLVPFHNYWYGGATGSSRIWAYGDITGTPSFTETAYSTAGVPVCQGITTADDKLVIPCSSGIAMKNGAGTGPTDQWSTFSLVPSGYTPSDVVEVGDYVHIIAYPENPLLNSKSFVWDKVSEDLSDVIDLGEGRAMLAGNIDGELVVVCALNSSSALALRSRMVIRNWSGGAKARPLFELISDDNTLSVYGNHSKFTEGSKLVFGMKIKLDGTTYNQLFAVGHKTANYPLAFSFDRLIDNDTTVSNNIQGMLKLGDFVFCAFNQDGSVNRTYNSSTVYTSVSPTLITQKLDGQMEGGPDVARHRKKLAMAGILCKPLASTNSVLSLYYRTDENTAWTLIRTYSDNNGTGFEAGMADTDGDGVPDAEFVNCHEFQFKVVHTQSSGAAPREPYMLVYAWEDLDADVQSE